MDCYILDRLFYNAIVVLLYIGLAHRYSYRKTLQRLNPLKQMDFQIHQMYCLLVYNAIAVLLYIGLAHRYSYPKTLQTPFPLKQMAC